MQPIDLDPREHTKMEEIAELINGQPLLVFIAKRVKIPDIASCIFKDIRDCYHQDPNSFVNDFVELRKRMEAVNNACTSSEAIDALCRYWIDLQSIILRFNLRKTKFTWSHAFDSKEHASIPDVQFELMNIRFNIGVCRFWYAQNEPRDTEESMKLALEHYRCAADAFQRNAQTSQEWSTVTSAPVNTFLHSVMLSYAQGCCVQKAIMDKMAPASVAKILQYIADTLEHAATTLMASSYKKISNNLIKHFPIWSMFHASQFHSFSQYAVAIDHEMRSEIGMAIGHLNAAIKCLEKTASHMPEYIHQAQISLAIFRKKHSKLVAFNRITYSQPVPELNALPIIIGRGLVKSLYFLNDYESCHEQLTSNATGIDGTECNATGGKLTNKREIFQNLMPLHAIQMASLYSEEKATLIRQIITLVGEKDEELSKTMSYLEQNDIALSYLDTRDVIPEEFIECQLLFRRDTEIIPRVTDLYRCLTALGFRTYTICADLKKKTRGKHMYYEIRDLESSINDTLKATSSLEDAITVGTKEARYLGYQRDEVLNAWDDHSYITEENMDKLQLFREMLIRVDKLKEQRASLIVILRENMQKDEISLASFKNRSAPEVFKSALAKHNKTIALIRRNLDAQERIIDTLAEVNAQFAPFHRRILDSVHRRDNFINRVVTSFHLLQNAEVQIAEGFKIFKEAHARLVKMQCLVLNNRSATLANRQFNRRECIVQPNPTIDNNIINALNKSLKVIDDAQRSNTETSSSTCPETDLNKEEQPKSIISAEQKANQLLGRRLRPGAHTQVQETSTPILEVDIVEQPVIGNRDPGATGNPSNPRYVSVFRKKEPPKEGANQAPKRQN